MKGNLSADIHLTATLSDKGELMSETTDGVVNVSVKEGELYNFEPVQKIQKFAFKNRNFSQIRFAELKEKMEIKGSRIKLNRMEIHSSVFTMFVEGIFDTKKGTDLSLQVPLSNLNKIDTTEELRNKGVDSKTGISVRLRAKTGDDGKLKISWDPFKKALKEHEEDSLSVGSTPVQDSIPVRDSISNPIPVPKSDTIRNKNHSDTLNRNFLMR
jgi:hypothetical protein